MSEQRTYLITGAAGFAAAHLIEHILKTTNDRVIGIDALTYSGTWDRLRDITFRYGPHTDTDGEYMCNGYDHPRFRPLVYDFRGEAEPNLVKELKEVTHVIHMGAESHVDNSIEDPLKFTVSNVVGTVNMLNLARKLPNLELFVYFSTDEVFGPAPMGSFKGFKESDLHSPKNPYAATKSAAEQMVSSFANTYGLPCIITRTMNLYAERQHKEKFIPICISKAIHGGIVQVHATADKKQAGLRTYIHARNMSHGLLHILKEKQYLKVSPQEVESYHLVGEKEVDNLTLALKINELTGHLGELKGIHCKGLTAELVDFHSSRPGHDLRYMLDGSKMAVLGWKPPKTFEDSLRKTIDWTLENQQWLS